MKTITTLLTLIAVFMTMTSFKSEKVLVPATIRTAQKIVTALQQSSVEEYQKLTPSIDELFAVMNKNAALYGANLNEAKDELTSSYNTQVIPAIRRESFSRILTEGERGIDWTLTKFVSVEQNKKDQNSFILIINSAGFDYRLQIENVMVVDGELRVSQFIKFV